jgi:hypothetical protein
MYDCSGETIVQATLCLRENPRDMYSSSYVSLQGMDSKANFSNSAPISNM